MSGRNDPQLWAISQSKWRFRGSLTTSIQLAIRGWISSFSTLGILPNGLYDVMVTNPVTAAVSRFGPTNLRAAWTQQRTKEKRYRVAATEAGMLLHGLAIEVYGRWGDDSFQHVQSFHYPWDRQHQHSSGHLSQLLASPDFGLSVEWSSQRYKHTI